MSDLVGYRTKKVTTYGRRGNRSAFIPIHNDIDISPLRPSSTVPLSPTTPLKRPPLSTKLSQDFVNLPVPFSPDDNAKPTKKEKEQPKPKSKPIAIRSSSSGSDSPMFIRRIRPGRRAIIPSTPSAYAPSPVSSIKTSTSRIDCVEIPVPRLPRRGATQRSRLGRYRESSEDLAEDLKELVIADPSSSVFTAEPSTPLEDATKSGVSSTAPTLEEVCSVPDVQSFDNIFAISRSFGSSASAQPVQIIKAGEATYSEVFSVMSGRGRPAVMKVIPIKRVYNKEEEEGSGMPYQSPAGDVAKEVEITKRMSKLDQGGFVQFIGAYIVRGEYHPQLLAQWDDFAKEHGTENVRPSSFTSEQEYVVIFLHDGGVDLEAFRFNKKVGWVQASGVFWQVADALARAEQWTEFEHRDLHEGQILIETSVLSSTDDNYLNPNSTGIRATIIDFGLSRLKADDEDRVVCTAISEDILEGEGEQWDVYRAICKRVKGDWEGSHPVTNLMWLQYILGLLLTRTSTLKKPRSTTTAAKPRSTTRITSSNRRSKPALTPEADRAAAAYARLVQLKEAIDLALGSKARRGAAKLEIRMECASDLMSWAREQGWFA